MNKKVLHKISYGMYIVASKSGEKLNGQIANSVFQISSNPILVAISINKENLTHEFIENSKLFSVSILSQDTPMEFIGKFGFKSGRDTNKFDGTDYKMINDVPVVLNYAVGYIVAKVIGSTDAATHTIFIGEVLDGDILSDGTPMTYDYYHAVKKGLVPKNAPHYIGEEEKNETKTEKSTGKKYRCRVCGYIYDPEVGDPDGGIAPGTPFEEIPDDWVCPVCGAAKSDFEEV